jgi:hypothetical protein
MSVKYSCVMDRPAKFQHQTLLWVLTLLERGGRTAEELVVHAVEGVPRRQIDLLRGLGVHVEVVRRYSAAHPFLNRLRQLESVTLRSAEHVVLCDTDLAFCAPIDRWVGGNRPRLKIVDVANPPLPIWQTLFKAAGFSSLPRAALTSLDGFETYANNCNGGLCILPGAVFAALPAVWPRWVGWVLRQRGILGRFRTHVFQISFALAMEEMGVEVDLLPLALNFPTNLPIPKLADHDIDPLVIHYHGNLNFAGRLNPVGLPQVDAAIAATNALMQNCTDSVLMQAYHQSVARANSLPVRMHMLCGRAVRKLKKLAWA